MEILIAGGTGFVGQYLVKYFSESGHSVTILGRSKAKIYEVFNKQFTAINWDDLSEITLQKTDLIINLAGANIAAKRWTDKRKQLIIDSRIKTTQQIVSLCCRLGENSPPLFNASALGIYGTQKAQKEGLPPALNENTSIDFDNPVDFSSKVTRLWEKETEPAKEKGIRVVNMRFALIMGPDGGALSKLVLPFKFGLGGKISDGKQPFSWVCIKDVAKAIDFLFAHSEISGPVNIASPQCVTQKEFAKTLCKVLNKPCLMTAPAPMLKIMLGEMAEELLLKGQHIYPKVLLDHGFKFEYESLESTLKYALNQ